MKFSDGSRNKYIPNTSQLSTPFYSQPSLRIYAATNGLGWGAQIDFAPGAGNLRYATACSDILSESYSLLSLLAQLHRYKSHGSYTPANS